MKRILGPLAFGAIGCAILISLGVWQMQRLAWKKELIDTTERMMSAQPIALPEAPTEATEEYVPVSVEGFIREGEIHVLTTQRIAGPGFRIIAPFETNEGRRILVDRGYVPEEQKNAERPIGAARLNGVLHWPDERTFDTPENDVEDNYWLARDVDQMAEVLGTEEVMIAVAASSIEGGPQPVPLTAAYHNRHLEYVITWFGLALGWALMTGVWVVARLKD